ncbi:hypothetical protein QBC35DRAFT_552355 [Podospora australis]|uniref:Uncharacterized protein n=1 Tax=Podospora australis TaxID=1536484 RepID=A0AAN6WHJ8_9PEZI|nr:hypothetical protein QBC35DRAFT_552355 [Podospora australis]
MIDAREPTATTATETACLTTPNPSELTRLGETQKFVNRINTVVFSKSGNDYTLPYLHNYLRFIDWVLQCEDKNGPVDDVLGPGFPWLQLADRLNDIPVSESTLLIITQRDHDAAAEKLSRPVMGDCHSRGLPWATWLDQQELESFMILQGSSFEEHKEQWVTVMRARCTVLGARISHISPHLSLELLSDSVKFTSQDPNADRSSKDQQTVLLQEAYSATGTSESPLLDEDEDSAKIQRWVRSNGPPPDTVVSPSTRNVTE